MMTPDQAERVRVRASELAAADGVDDRAGYIDRAYNELYREWVREVPGRLSVTYTRAGNIQPSLPCSSWSVREDGMVVVEYENRGRPARKYIPMHAIVCIDEELA